jgi:hypothetical protein
MLGGYLPRQETTPVVSDQMKLSSAEGIREGENI